MAGGSLNIKDINNTFNTVNKYMISAKLLHVHLFKERFDVNKKCLYFDE